MIVADQRRSRGRPAVPLARILSAAIELVDEQGADALSMRALAQRLGSGTATLYRHFGSRSELIASLVDQMIDEIDTASIASLPWQQACISFAHSMFDAIGRHGNVASLVIGHVRVGPNALAQRELVLSILLDNGFAPTAAAHAYATVSRYVLGFAIQVPANQVSSEAETSAAFRRLDPARYPATAAVADELPVALADEFEFGLRLIVAGLERLPGSAHPKSAEVLDHGVDRGR